MGAAAAAVEETVRETVEDASPKINNYLGDLTNDPARAAAALVTSGGTEAVRESAIAVDSKMKEEALRNAPKLAPPPGKTPEPPGDGAKEPDKKEPIKEAADEQKRSRGRASTILTGRRGLSGDATTARRTLLGV